MREARSPDTISSMPSQDHRNPRSAEPVRTQLRRRISKLRLGWAMSNGKIGAGETRSMKFRWTTVSSGLYKCIIWAAYGINTGVWEGYEYTKDISSHGIMLLRYFQLCSKCLIYNSWLFSVSRPSLYHDGGA